MSSKRAPKPIAMKAPKLNVAGLQEAYEWAPANKILALKLAFAWYATNIAALLFGDPLDADRKRNYERAVKAKALGDGSNIESEKIQAYTTALHLYESKVWPAKNLPKVDAALNAAAPSKRIAGIQTVLSNLNAAFSNNGITFGVTMGTEREFSEGNILLPQTELDKMIAQPPLATVLGEVLTVAKVTSIATTEDGQSQLDGGKFMAALPNLMTAVSAWAIAADGKLTHPVGKAPKTPKLQTARIPKSPRTAGGPVIPAIDPLGVFRANTAKAEIASILADFAFHPRIDLETVCDRRSITRGQVNTALKDLAKKGYRIEKQGKDIRIVK